MNNDLERLRKLILGAEYDELLALKARLDDSALSSTVADVITEALSQREHDDNSVSEVLAPSIDRAISSSINQDPKKLAESLYPIMGPAIRKSISETLQQMLENFNDLLEQSLSPQALRWRFDAWRTGRSYSELVLLNTLEFRVEQVFLIHAETSLLIQHVVHEMVAHRDADMVSGMFSAIQDFIQDSFETEEGDVLDTLRLGDLTVVIVRGPLAFLAVVIRGRLPDQLRAQATETLEKIHRQRRDDLSQYSGDPSLFDDIYPVMHALIQDRKRDATEEARQIPWLAVGAIIVLAGIALYFANERANERAAVAKHRSDFIAQIESIPGVVLLDASITDSQLALNVLRDPLADKLDMQPHPEATISALQITEKPYLAMDDEILTRRVRQRFPPDQETRVAVENGVLRVSGQILVDWLERVEAGYVFIEGVTSLDTSGAVIHNPNEEAFARLSSMIESFTYDFERADVELSPSDVLTDLARDIIDLVNLQTTRGQRVKIDVVGITDASGAPEYNRVIGKQRAESLIRFLESQQVPGSIMQAYSGLEYQRTANLTERGVRIFVEALP